MATPSSQSPSSPPLPGAQAGVDTSNDASTAVDPTADDATSPPVPDQAGPATEAPPAAAAVLSALAMLPTLGTEGTDHYEYLDIPDPDAKHMEKELPSNGFVRAVIFLTRGSAIPWIPMAAVLIYTTALVILSYAVRDDDEDVCDSRWWCSVVTVDSEVASYVGFALFLLLGFRVNESYNRYMRAVTLWNDDIDGGVSALVTYTTLAFRHGIFHARDRERILGLAAGYAESLKRSLRDERDLRELKPFLSRDDLARLQAAPDMPTHCILLLRSYAVEATRKKDSRMPGPFFTLYTNLLDSLAGYAGECGRIKKYKMVYSYTNHLRVFMVIWFLLLPLAIVETSGWLTILWCPFITLGIWGAETAAHELADPFGYDYNDIRLGVFTRDILEGIKTVYKKSLAAERVTSAPGGSLHWDPALSRASDTPDMLNMPGNVKKNV